MKVLLVAETGAVRWRDDGVAPTPSSGMIIEPTMPVFEYSGDVTSLLFIAVSGTVAIDASFYRDAG